MADTITPYLGLTAPEVGTPDYAPKINANLPLIDAFVPKTVYSVSSGGATPALTIALPNVGAITVSRFRLVMGSLRVPAGAQLYCRFSNDGGSTYASGASDYDYARTDLSAKSAGTQTFDGSSGASAIFLSPALRASVPSEAGSMTLDIDLFANAGNFSTHVIGSGQFINNDGSGYRTAVQIAGAFLPTTAAATHVRISGVLAGNFSQTISCFWSLLSVPFN